ncbi:MAG TPA: hypothetical protein VK563_17730 [Puia sp.]|nr:hypothetical protein [Puia sp.]
MLKKAAKWVLICAGAGLLLYGILLAFARASFSDALETTYTKKDLIDNFKARKDEIFALRNYFKSIVPQNRKVEIEFSSNSLLGRFGVSTTDATGSIIYPIFLKWDLKTTSVQVDSVITTLHWTQQTLQVLKAKLDSAHCISVRNGDPCRIGFQRSGMGMYFYELFTNPVPDNAKARYNDGCTYIFYNPVLVLEYGGGAIGPQCFPKDQ